MSPSPCMMSLSIWGDCVQCFKQYWPTVLNLQVRSESASPEKAPGVFLRNRVWSRSRYDAKSMYRV